MESDERMFLKISTLRSTVWERAAASPEFRLTFVALLYGGA